MKAERDAAPAAVPRKHGLGRPGVAVRAHYGALPSRAGRGLDEGGRKSAGSGGVIPIVLAPEARSPGQKSPRMERRKATRVSLRPSQGRSGTRHHRCCAVRRSISPHPFRSHDPEKWAPVFGPDHAQENGVPAPVKQQGRWRMGRVIASKPKQSGNNDKPDCFVVSIPAMTGRQRGCLKKWIGGSSPQAR